MTLLILGGTNDARRLADSLFRKGMPIIYSLAGLVRTPEVDYPVAVGGFTQYGGLAEFIKQKGITGILDVTHPYAQKISSDACQVAIDKRIPYWLFDRPAWQATQEDQWFEFTDWVELCSILKTKQSIFITTGQLDQATVVLLSEKLTAKIYLRTAVKPSVTLPKEINWVQSIGPFKLEDELTFMQTHGVDALVSKNSGGSATVAKLQATRQLKVPVFFLMRPVALTTQNAAYANVYSDLSVCEDAVWQHMNKVKPLDKSLR